jgi:hypothetical protein
MLSLFRLLSLGHGVPQRGHEVRAHLGPVFCADALGQPFPYVPGPTRLANVSRIAMAAPSIMSSVICMSSTRGRTLGFPKRPNELALEVGIAPSTRR